MFTLFHPTESQIHSFLEQQRTLPYSYPEVGRTCSEEVLKGYNNDFNFIELGKGEVVWEAAKEAIRQWRMFPGEWAFIAPGTPPIATGTVVAMAARVVGMWWLNSCRIVYVLDDERQFGFAYGTLPGHVERGEEIFMVEKMPDGTVRYVIKAFSWPRHWLARLGYGLARAYQRKFVRDSKNAMLRAVSHV